MNARRPRCTRKDTVGERHKPPLVGAGQRRQELSGLVRGDGIDVDRPRPMKQKQHARVRDTLVTKAHQQRGGAARTRNHSGVKPHPLRPAPRERIADKPQRGQVPPGRSDDELDNGIEVNIDHEINRVDEVEAGLPTQLAGKRDKSAIMTMMKGDRHECSPQELGRPGRASDNQRPRDGAAGAIGHSRLLVEGAGGQCHRHRTRPACTSVRADERTDTSAGRRPSLTMTKRARRMRIGDVPKRESTRRRIGRPSREPRRGTRLSESRSTQSD